MREENPALSSTDVISLGDEQRTSEVLAQCVLGLWQLVNNLMRLRRTTRGDFRVTIAPEHWCTISGCLLSIALSSCSSTHVVTRWQDPATSQIVFTKILALVIGGDQSLVRAGEGDLCRQVAKVPCKPA